LALTLLGTVGKDILAVGSIGEGDDMRGLNGVLAAALILAPLSAQAADLVVWWVKGFYAQEDEALAEIVEAFEQDTGKRVELVQPAYDEVFDKLQPALEAGQPPDFLFALYMLRGVPTWAYEGRLVDLQAALAPVLDLFDADVIEAATFFNRSAGRRGLYALPMGRSANYVHVWKSLLEQAGFTLDDIPKKWQAFWSFWCDEVQPAVRQATGRDDIWGIGLPMSAAGLDTSDMLFQFQGAYQAPWLDREGRLQVDDPEVRERMIQALEDYASIWRKDCTPPDSATWNNVDNNKAFIDRTVVMTANGTLSIPSALKRERPDDYYENAATIDWPDGADGQPLLINGTLHLAVVFKDGKNPALATDFVRFLAEEGWLAHWLTFAGDRMLPPMRKLVEQPFWLDPSDPHRMRAAIQLLSRPHHYTAIARDYERQSGRIWGENVWGKAVNRVVADGLSPQQAVDEAIARIKEILSE
jgi:multiple sugar transport system substrate-binding protein